MNEMNRKLTAMIVDDEDLARAIVRELLKPHADIEILGECANGFEAVKLVSERKPDLLFLDIQMPKLDGFEVLELIGPDIAVIFVTAYDEHALRAFEVHAVDYLLKPVGAERFEAALERGSQTPLADSRSSQPIRGEERHYVCKHRLWQELPEFWIWPSCYCLPLCRRGAWLSLAAALL